MKDKNLDNQSTMGYHHVCRIHFTEKFCSPFEL